MSWAKLMRFRLENPTISYDEEKKKRFKKLGRTALTEIAHKLERTHLVKNCHLDYNPGGIAVSGDWHLRGDFVHGGSFDFFFNFDGFSNCAIYRKTKSQTDYTGERNNPLPFDVSADYAARCILALDTK